MIKFLIKEKKLPNLVSLDNKDTFNAKVKLTIKFTKPIILLFKYTCGLSIEYLTPA